MAHRGVGRVGNRPPMIAFDRLPGRKRRIVYIEEGFDDFGVPDEEEYPLNRPLKRRRESFTLDVHFQAEDVAVWPVARAGMERTASGHSISDDLTDHRPASTELLEDAAAAQRVREHMTTFKRRNPDSKHERVLRNIISPKTAASTYPLDNEALESIFLAANEIFFHGRLSKRVTWDWSHSSSPHYDSSIIGTTALRRASNRGFETLIVLSSPILQDRKYSRRLLISTFLHELIHSYLFICCGFRARHCGGHTPGFHSIARLVDDWAGPDSFLYLSKTDADLSCFRAETVSRDLDPGSDADGGGSAVGWTTDTLDHRQKRPVYPCSAATEHQQSRHDLHGHARWPSLQRCGKPERVVSFEEGYDSYNDRQWPDEQMAHPEPHRHRPHRVTYFDDAEPQRPGSPYV